MPSLYLVIRKDYPNDYVIYDSEDLSEARDYCISANDNSCYMHYMKKASDEYIKHKQNEKLGGFLL